MRGTEQEAAGVNRCSYAANVRVSVANLLDLAAWVVGSSRVVPTILHIVL